MGKIIGSIYIINKNLYERINNPEYKQKENSAAENQESTEIT